MTLWSTCRRLCAIGSLRNARGFTKRYVILAGPYDAPRVAEAEQILLDFLKVQLDWEHRYLAEHRENGFAHCQKKQLRFWSRVERGVSKVGHGDLDRWLLLMCLELYAEHQGLLGEWMPRIYKFYNEHLFRSDHGLRFIATRSSGCLVMPKCRL